MGDEITETNLNRDLLHNSNLYDLVHRVHLKSHQYQLKQLSKAGLRVSEYHVLVMITAEPGISQAKVVSNLRIDKTNLVRAMDRLELLGYAKRCSEPSDRRTYKLVPTDSGVQCALIYRNLFREAQKLSAEQLNQDELDQLLNLLERVALTV